MKKVGMGDFAPMGLFLVPVLGYFAIAGILALLGVTPEPKTEQFQYLGVLLYSVIIGMLLLFPIGKMVQRSVLTPKMGMFILLVIGIAGSVIELFVTNGHTMLDGIPMIWGAALLPLTVMGTIFIASSSDVQSE